MRPTSPAAPAAEGAAPAPLTRQRCGACTPARCEAEGSRPRRLGGWQSTAVQAGASSCSRPLLAAHPRGVPPTFGNPPSCSSSRQARVAAPKVAKSSVSRDSDEHNCSEAQNALDCCGGELAQGWLAEAGARFRQADQRTRCSCTASCGARPAVRRATSWPKVSAGTPSPPASRGGVGGLRDWGNACAPHPAQQATAA